MSFDHEPPPVRARTTWGRRTINPAPCPKTLREVRYKCALCDGVSAFRFARDYLPFKAWLARCQCCRRYALLRALGRVVTGMFR